MATATELEKRVIKLEYELGLTKQTVEGRKALVELSQTNAGRLDTLEASILPILKEMKAKLDTINCPAEATRIANNEEFVRELRKMHESSTQHWELEVEKLWTEKAQKSEHDKDISRLWTAYYSAISVGIALYGALFAYLHYSPK